MSATPPSFAIAIAAYNRGTAIARTLDSVLSQSLPAVEVIVVDDGSVDDTAAFVRSNYPQVRLVSIAHGGQSVARNRGAEEACADVVVHFDSDDVMMPHALATFADLFRTFPEARAAFADHRYENAITNVIWENHHRTQPQFSRLRATPVVRSVGEARLYDRRLYYAMLRGNLLQQPWAIYRETFQRLGGFAAGFRSNEDWDLFLRIVYETPVVLTDRVISTHLVEKDRDHVHLSPGQDENNIRVIQRHLGFRSWRDTRATWILKGRMAQYQKDLGDRAVETDIRKAWAYYLQSFLNRPFDHVVAARLLFWPLQMLCSRGSSRHVQSQPVAVPEPANPKH